MYPFLSLLSLPADQYPLLDKSARKGADARIFDLEDSVAPSAKERARENIAHYLSQHPESLHNTYIRINPPGPEQEKDIRLLRRLSSTLAGILVSKTERKADLDQLAAALDKPQLPLLPLIESAYSLLQSAAIAQHPQVQALVFGSEDFCYSVGCDADIDILSPYFQQLVLAAKSAHKYAIGFPESVGNYRDLNRLERALRHAFHLGADAAFCIHPSQIHSIHHSFIPTDEAVTWANDIIQQAKVLNKPVFSWHKQMIEAPHIQKAKRILALSTRAKMR